MATSYRPLSSPVSIASPPRNGNALALDAILSILFHSFHNSAMERAGCVGEAAGWISQSSSARRSGRVVAAPLYRKSHSWGEFVFWVELGARLRSGGTALLPQTGEHAAVPPATGPRSAACSGCCDLLARATSAGNCWLTRNPSTCPRRICCSSPMKIARRSAMMPGYSVAQGLPVPLAQPRLPLVRRLHRHISRRQAQKALRERRRVQ